MKLTFPSWSTTLVVFFGQVLTSPSDLGNSSQCTFEGIGIGLEEIFRAWDMESEEDEDEEDRLTAKLDSEALQAVNLIEAV